MYVLLPEWLDLAGSDTDILEFHSNSTTNENLGIRGSRPYDWQHAICLESGRGGVGDPTECTDESEDLIWVRPKIPVCRWM